MRALIIDDEPLPAKHLAVMIQQHCFEIQNLETFHVPSLALEHLKTQSYDIVFLDVEMPEMNGFQFLKKAMLPSSTQVIFTTAYSQYAVPAFGVNATHYILKPVQEMELIQAVRKAIQQQRTSKVALETEPPTLTVFDGENYIVLQASEIIRMEADGSYTKIVTTRQEPILASRRLGYFEKKVPGKDFFRCHHSHLINLQHISKINKGKSGFITLMNSDAVPVSKVKKEELHQLLGI